MCVNESYREDLVSLLKYRNKIFLNKKCDNVINRHVFYTTQNENGNHFYHVRYILTENNEVESIRDFPVISIPLTQTEKYNLVVEDTIEKILNFINVNGYEVSCDRKDN